MKDRDTSTCRWLVLTSDADMCAGGEVEGWRLVSSGIGALGVQGPRIPVPAGCIHWDGLNVSLFDAVSANGLPREGS